VNSRPHQSEHVLKNLPEAQQLPLVLAGQKDKPTFNDAHPSGFRVRQVVSIDPHPLVSAHRRLGSILAAVEQLSKKCIAVLRTIRQQPTRQSQTKEGVRIRPFIARSASGPPIRRFVSKTDEKPRFDNVEVTARMHQVNEIIVRSSDIITRSIKLLTRSIDQYKKIASNTKERIKRIRAKQQSQLVGLRMREMGFSEYLKAMSGTSWKPGQIDNEPLLQNLGSIESKQIRRKAAIVVRRSTTILRTKVDQSRAIVSNIQEDLRKALQYIDRLESCMRAARHSAFDVYGLHVALRLRLGKMILYRQKRSHRSKMAFGRLERRLLELRAFDEVLFSNESTTSPQQIRQSLTQLELKNEVQRSLVRRMQLGSQLRRRIPLAKQGHRKNREARPAALPIRYCRIREHKFVAPVRRLPGRIPYSIRYHESRHDRKPAPRTERARPRRSAVEKKKSDKLKLLDTVSSWLGGGEAEIPEKEVEGVKRVFGGRAFGRGR
jgi:hypothetical protein